MLKNFFYAIGVASCIFLQFNVAAQCVVEGSVFPTEIACGDRAELTASGRGQGLQVFSENFNSGTAVGWSFTQQALFTNPCSPSGVDSTVHIWMGNTSGVPRSLETLPYNFSAATSGATVCFDLLFATQTGDPATAPCEGPDEPDEGVHLQYSIDGGVTWIEIQYFDPNGGYDPQLTNWSNWCIELPPQALTDSTQIRWFQDNDSGADFDHWGLDNVTIYYNDPTYEIVWQHDHYSYGPGSSGGIDPTPVHPQQTTDYVVTMSNGFSTCSDTVTVTVIQPVVTVNAGPDLRVCDGECATINATAKVVKSPAKTPTYLTKESVAIPTFGTSASLNINITNLNMSTVLPGSITQVCIIGLFYLSGDIIDIYLVCPSGARILLVPSVAGANTYTNACFTPLAVDSFPTNPISFIPITGTFIPEQPFNDLAGCTANGLWSIEIKPHAIGGIFIGAGTFSGWSISFNDPELSYTGELSWMPSAGLSDTNSLHPVVCPTQDITYTITASDTAGCVIKSDAMNITVDTVNLNITAAVTSPACGGTDGAIDLTVTGGSGSYTYIWSNGEITQDIDTIEAGIYSVSVTDPAHCQEDTLFSLSTTTGPAIDTITATPETCFGLHNGTATVSASGGTGALHYTWSNGRTTATVTGLLPNTYTVTVSDALGCESSAFITVAAGPNIIAFFTSTDETCNSGCDATITVTASGGTAPLSFQWSNSNSTTPARTGLCYGLYGFTVTDATNCTESGSVFINSGPELSVYIGEDLTFCQGLSATLDAGSGFTEYNWSTADTTQTVEVTESGDYSVTVNKGTCTVSDAVNVNVVPTPVVNALPNDTTVIVNNTVAITTTVDGAGNGTYSWAPPDNLSCNDCASPVATLSAEGDVFYVITYSDSLECSGTDTVFITVLPENFTPHVPSAFTPNGDTHNDEIFVFPTGVTVKEFRVYNRWGQEVHNAPTPWNGVFEGKEQPIGTFTYYTVVQLPDASEKRLSGAFSLLR